MLGHQAPRFGAILQTFAALFWLAQAAAIAWAVQSLLENRGMAAVWPAALTVLLVGVIRSLVEAWGGRVLYRSARAHISSLRHDALISLATRSPQDTQRASSGEAASVLAEQAEALLPYLLRYLPVQQRVMILPLLIAAVTTWFSWMAALVLLFAAPLIPMFMALVGWQAKAAAEKQWVEAGAMNGFSLTACAASQLCAPWTPSSIPPSACKTRPNRCANAPCACCVSPFYHQPYWSCFQRSGWHWLRFMWVSTCLAI
uniref:ABC transporter transmembrane domain-containing protein n=1 Tax=Pseudomonas sp. ITEM 17296 TaxID=2790281 RepID=UPI002380BD98|nr:ABC transporter transmembrane domain-containing protein [Pseudomonas sp. ITEM 17296]